MSAMILRADVSDEERKRIFAENLHKQLLVHNWSASDLGRAAGKMNRENISRYLRGVSLPNEKSLSRLAHACGVTPDELVPGANWAPPVPQRKDEEFRVVSSTVPGLVRLTVDKLVSPAIATRVMEILTEDACIRAADGS